jgi:hypothetical protein
MLLSRRGRVFAATALMPLVFGLAACGGSNDEEEGEGAPLAACPTDLGTAADTQPPDDVPLPDGAGSAYEYFPQGETQVWNFAVDGESGDLTSMRDDYLAQLEDAGYEIEDTDAEEGFEAEAEFNGPHEGTVVYRMLCEGTVGLRLKLLS